MANYNCAIRTNYFHVADEKRFRELLGQACGCEDAVILWEEKDQDGKTVFGFGCYGGNSSISVVEGDEDEEEFEDTSYDKFIEELQKCVAEDDAVIIFVAGNENLRYVAGTALIITRSDVKYIDLIETAVKEAARMLGQPGWRSKCDCWKHQGI